MSTSLGNMGVDFVSKVVSEAKPEKLTLPVPPRVDHAEHMVDLALKGHTKLAADHVLFREMKGKLCSVIGATIRRLNLTFRDLEYGLTPEDEGRLKDFIIKRFRAYDFLFELTWNLVGLESRRVGFYSDEVNASINAILNALKELEERERKLLGGAPILEVAIREQLNGMKVVNKGNSMLAYIAEEVEKKLNKSNLSESYFRAMSEALTSNFYYVASLRGVCKFGNDYALGLRWLRHLGYVQVSVNPNLAARAYDDVPKYWEDFKEFAKDVLFKEHPEWFKDPDKYADDIAMEATRFVLLENFQVFRPVFYWSNYHDGLVSYQLNPLKADKVDESVKDAITFYTRLERDLKVYDEYLLWGYSTPAEKGRPNIVIKVSAAYPASLEIAEKINEMGIGQNITVSYTVAQEVLVGVAALRGMAKAFKKGILPTQTYDTNMGGRLEDHLRESIASDLLVKGLERLDEGKREEVIRKLAEGLGAKLPDGFEKLSLREKADFLTSKRVLGRNLLRDAFVDALTSTGAFGSREEVVKMLSEIQGDLALSGTFVAQRVYEILFSPWNREKWIEYLVREVGISREEAKIVLDRLDLLPASKRKPIDTLYTFASRNMTNTEFPNHQLAVLKESLKEGFRLDDFSESIYKQLSEESLKRLMKYEDFVKAYEASPEVNELLKKVGIPLQYGSKGVSTKDWPDYGPCRKTMTEFTNGYLKFRAKVVEIVKELAKELGV